MLLTKAANALTTLRLKLHGIKVYGLAWFMAETPRKYTACIFPAKAASMWVCDKKKCKEAKQDFVQDGTCGGLGDPRSEICKSTCMKTGKYAPSANEGRKLCKECALLVCAVCKKTERPSGKKPCKYHVVNRPEWMCNKPKCGRARAAADTQDA